MTRSVNVVWDRYLYISVLEKVFNATLFIFRVYFLYWDPCQSEMQKWQWSFREIGYVRCILFSSSVPVMLPTS